MKKLIYLVLAFGAMLGFSACKQKEQAKQDETPKYLVLYYSQTGTTKAVAQYIQQRLGADIEEIQLENPYSDDYDETIQRCKQEMADSVVPTVKPLNAKIADYDVVFIGYPVWFGTYALPIAGLIQNEDFDGKTVVPFCTFGSGGLENSESDLAAALPKAKVAEGYGVRTARQKAAPSEIDRFLIENGYMEGEITALPDYSEQRPVSDEEKAIFEAACSSYRFPLGTPTTVGKRGTADGVDYEFKAAAKNFDGEDVSFTIYVTVPNDGQPEFTRVER